MHLTKIYYVSPKKINKIYWIEKDRERKMILREIYIAGFDYFKIAPEEGEDIPIWDFGKI